jgi:hypothetical protein
MIGILKSIDKYIPLWELLVIVIALFSIVLVLILWWAFGYNLIVVPEPTELLKPAALAALI